MGALAALLTATIMLPQVQVRESPKDWKLIKTEHFDVYYPDDGLEKRAKEFGGWFEEAKDLVKETTKLDIRRRINVFLYRSIHDLRQASFLGQFNRDSLPVFGIGGKSLLTRNSFEYRPRWCRFAKKRALALAEPVHDRILIHCQDTDRMNLWFLRHELVHHAEFELVYPWRIPSWLIALKNPLIPAWWWEGFAEYGSRFRDSRQDEFMRDLTEEGLYRLDDLFEFDTINLYDFRAPYEQGHYFFDFVREKYGEDTARNIFNAAGSGIPFSAARLVAKGTGKSMKAVEKEFREHLKAKYAEMMKGRSHASDFARRLTDTRSHYRRRTWGGRVSPDGSKIAYISDKDVRTELYVAPMTDPSDASGMFGLSRGIDVNGLHSAPSWSPDGKRLVLAGWWKNFDYLFIVHLDNGIESVRLDFDEVYDPCFSPDGNAIVFSGLKDGYSDLYVYRNGKVERLTEDRHADRMPAWNPDGSSIAFIREIRGRMQLHVLDLESKEVRKVSESNALVDHPRWMPDGKSVLVSADINGVFDVFRVELNGTAHRVTNVRIGAHFPDITPDGKQVVFTYQRRRGRDLFVMDYQEQEEPFFDQDHRDEEYDPVTEPNPMGEKAEPGLGFDLEWLMLPVTSQSFLTPGLEMRIADVYGENAINLSGFFLGGEAWGGGLSLVKTSWQPTYIAGAYGGRLGDIQELGAGAGLGYPLLPTFAVGAAWSVRDRHEIEDSPFPQVFDSGPVLGAVWSNMSGYRRRDAAWGYAVGGVFSWYDEEFGGDRDLRETVATLELAHDIVQDFTVGFQVVFRSLDGQVLLDDEKLEMEFLVRGANEDLEGTEQTVITLEFRFPIWRDILFRPLAWAKLPDMITIKDIRGFVFAQGGYMSNEGEDRLDEENTTISLGVGLRLDTVLQIWPLLNVRAPLRFEFWGAWVSEDDDEEGSRFEGGIGITF